MMAQQNQHTATSTSDALPQQNARRGNNIPNVLPDVDDGVLTRVQPRRSSLSCPDDTCYKLTHDKVGICDLKFYILINTNYS